LLESRSGARTAARTSVLRNIDRESCRDCG
jgi:hypothetical protein